MCVFCVDCFGVDGVCEGVVGVEEFGIRDVDGDLSRRGVGGGGE